MGAEQKGASEEVIKQGEAGNKFYVLESGMFTCLFICSSYWH